MRNALVVFLMVAICGCGTPPPARLVPKATEAELPPKSVHVYVNDFGQRVEEVGARDLEEWLAGNKDCEIVSITSVALQNTCNNANPTSGFLVVYVRRERTEKSRY
jgi:hypothetical protein